MNKAILMGRLTKDPEMRTTASQIPVASFTLAVDRRFKKQGEERQADFIPIIAWRQQAEFCGKYFHKGSRMVVVGSIQTRTWDDNEGKRLYATEVIADEIYFGDSRRGEGGSEAPAQTAPSGSTPAGDGFFPGPDDDTALPFDT